MGEQPDLAHHMQQVAKLLPGKPTSIVVLSAHWEANPIQITSHTTGSQHLLFDYIGFPPETYDYDYPAPGNPELSLRIRTLLEQNGITSALNSTRGLDHGVFVPLKLMFPNADIPVVAVSLSSTSLNAKEHIKIGRALSPLRDDGILILGSGYTFHNMKSLFHPTYESIQASMDFNEWLKETLSTLAGVVSLSPTSRMDRLIHWTEAPGARQCHPREEHLLPLFMVAAASDFVPARLIYDTTSSPRNHEDGNHGVTGYIFD
jgi:aromatic ring-opening dioxygenase catalytic subunit (LigB family)